MSIDNIKELFLKRVQDSVAFNVEANIKNTANENKVDADNLEEQEQIAGLTETNAGITEYLTSCKGFSAVIKQRYSDFHVHEIDKDDNIVYLNNYEIPEVKEEPVNEEAVSQEIWDKLKNLSNKVVESVEVDVTEFTKDERRVFHKAVKSRYGSLIKSNTVSDNNKKTLVLTLGKDQKRESSWFSELGKYLHFVLFKKNLDTMEAVNILANYLKTKAAHFTYAGTKDKRANTTQRLSIAFLDAKRLNGLNKTLRDMNVGNFIYKDFPLKLGDLKGNMFEIALRNVTESDEVVNEACQTIKENGFINYFGLQRFGNSAEVPTYLIGKALVKGDFKMAVELILKPRKGKMRNDMKLARKVWWETKDALKAFKCLRSKDRTIEGKLLLGLSKHGQNAYINALDCIPRNVRLLYLHAYQSFIWNKVLSKRFKQFGKSVLENDLVLVENNLLDEKQEEKEEEAEEAEEAESENEENEGDSNKNKLVRAISKEEIDKFKITDIVHPLPGHNVMYPNNIIKEWYDELLKEDGLTSEDMKQTVRKYSLSGTYRHIVKTLKDVSWYNCYYSDPEEDLILSDVDKMKKQSLDLSKNDSNKYKAVVLKFSLDSSTYATMALREILKIDTSCSYQATLNSYSNKRSFENDSEELRKKVKS